MPNVLQKIELQRICGRIARQIDRRQRPPYNVRRAIGELHGSRIARRMFGSAGRTEAHADWCGAA
jgi:hypothetical protein